MEECGHSLNVKLKISSSQSQELESEQRLSKLMLSSFRLREFVVEGWPKNYMT